MGSRIGSGSSSYSMKSTQFGSGTSGTGGAHKGHHHKHVTTQGTTQEGAYTQGSGTNEASPRSKLRGIGLK